MQFCLRLRRRNEQRTGEGRTSFTFQGIVAEFVFVWFEPPAFQSRLGTAMCDATVMVNRFSLLIFFPVKFNADGLDEGYFAFKWSIELC